MLEAESGDSKYGFFGNLYNSITDLIRPVNPFAMLAERSRRKKFERKVEGYERYIHHSVMLFRLGYGEITIGQAADILWNQEIVRTKEEGKLDWIADPAFRRAMDNCRIYVSDNKLAREHVWKPIPSL
jgi:hypothetical protein